MLKDVVYSNQFKKDYKLSVKRNLDVNILMAVITSLTNEEELDAKFRDHPLNIQSSHWRYLNPAFHHSDTQSNYSAYLRDFGIFHM